ncbi:TlpA disulfide reductase family protein [Longimicrobium sp.]|jgi:thiol-disulfide isomerase/thioredoxin|uniref:TlpA family protein disulfide reductase n=1 Tax=Longimicrobium sp. TaxID=2029185 RepID=UPI002EDB1B32
MRMMKVLSAAVVLLTACGDAPAGAVAVGKPVPPYVAQVLDGDRTSLADLQGRPVLLNVWATWCGPCQQEIPALEALHREYGPKGLRVVGVSIDQASEQQAVREFMQEYGVSFDVWLDPSGDVTSQFSMVGVPNTFLIGSDGTLLWKKVGPVHATDEELRGLIEKSLAAT